ncbi:MAG: SDR family NAD(P)-dependent oxidoreductase [Alphaproteobacteria bacterium]|nr:SDR family NAD(P)-dependent oxidoreductase [Alphaproteobacteria bacterium]
MSENKKRIVIIGATSAIAENCARLWVKDANIDLTLVGRNRLKTEKVAQDLRVRSPHSTIRVLETNFIDPLSIRQVVDGIIAEGPIHIVLIAHGSLPDQEVCQKNLNDCHDALVINGISPILFAEAFVAHMERVNKGILAIIGSVAGDRGRKSNYIYGSAKGLVERFAQGLQHRLALAKSEVKVVLVKPGPTDTPMTAHLKGKGGNLAHVEDVANLITHGINKGKSVVYAPAKWGLIMMVIRNLPNFVFKKMDI